MVIFTSHYSVLVEFIHSLKYLYFFYVIKLTILSICHIQWNRLFVQHAIYFNAITHTKLIGRSYCSRNIILHFLFGRFLLMCGFFISNSNTIKKSLCKSFRSIHICAYLWHPSHLYSGFGLPGKTQFVGQYSRCDCGPVIASPAHQHHSQPRHTALGADRHLSGAGGHLWRTERGLAGG